MGDHLLFIFLVLVALSIPGVKSATGIISFLGCCGGALLPLLLLALVFVVEVCLLCNISTIGDAIRSSGPNGVVRILASNYTFSAPWCRYACSNLPLSRTLMMPISAIEVGSSLTQNAAIAMDLKEECRPPLQSTVPPAPLMQIQLQ